MLHLELYAIERNYCMQYLPLFIGATSFGFESNDLGLSKEPNNWGWLIEEVSKQEITVDVFNLIFLPLLFKSLSVVCLKSGIFGLFKELKKESWLEDPSKQMN